MRHYSRRSENAYVHWIRQFIVFHGKKHPVSAILFLYRRVLELEIGALSPVVRAKRPTRVPVVLTEDEAVRLLSKLDRTV